MIHKIHKFQFTWFQTLSFSSCVLKFPLLQRGCHWSVGATEMLVMYYNSSAKRCKIIGLVSYLKLKVRVFSVTNTLFT